MVDPATRVGNWFGRRDRRARTGPAPGSRSMGLMRWMAGGDDNSAAAAAVSAGLAEIDGLFRPSRHKQTEHVEEAKRKRVDVANGTGIDLDRGVAMLRADGSATGASGADASDED